MKPHKPLIDPFAPVQKRTPADRGDPHSRHEAQADFARGVDVVEVMETMPAELWDLFQPKTEGQ